MYVEFHAPNRKVTAVDAIGFIGIIGLMVARFIPVARIIPFWGCTFRQVTGYPCPGCGLTRVADRFAHGDVLGAFKVNPLGTVAASLFAFAAAATVLHFVFAAPMPEVTLNAKENKAFKWLVVGAVIANYLYVIAAHRLLHYR
jgi:Protein of unknown function (DUF2752)